MRPPSGRSNPAIIRSSVVFPQPDGPSSVKNSPASTASVTLSTAAKSPKRRVTPSMESKAMVKAPLSRLAQQQQDDDDQQHGDRSKPAVARLLRECDRLQCDIGS